MPRSLKTTVFGVELSVLVGCDRAMSDKDVWLQEQLEAMEVGLEKAQSTFSQLDAQMSQSSQTAAIIGDRLHVRVSTSRALYSNSP